MKKSRIITISIVLAVAVIGYWIVSEDLKSSEIKYQLGEITKGDIKQTVSASGTVTPVTTVEVGTQISGTIDSVMVDFNDKVKSGQILAVLDTTLLQASVLDAEASVERAEALLREAESEHARNLALFEKNLISESVYLPFKIAARTRQADLKTARAALLRAKTNLQYAVIRSPIEGIVIQCNVEEGQTVAASLSTPTLFIIAQDLSQMEILAEVDESDIGVVKVGQSVEYEVAAYADQMFSGEVRKVRLQPQTVSNVVTYTVVVAAGNADGLLLPGMTATLDIVTESREDVLTIPTRALSYMPTPEVLAEMRARREASAQSERPRGPRSEGRIHLSDESGTRSMAWYLDSLGEITPAPILAGLSDGSTTEILASRNLTEGMQIIVSGTGTSSSKAESGSLAKRFGGPPGGPGGGFRRGL